VRAITRVATWRAGRRGATLIWTAVLMSLLILIASLAVDLGRVILVRSELQDAVDAAAREGAAVLPANLATVRNAVIAAAAQNSAYGSPVTISPANVQLLSVNGGTDNAVRVTASLHVPLLFGLNRFTSFDVSVAATARRDVGSGSAGGFGLIGLDGMTLTGSSVVDSYDASAGPYSSTKSDKATLASNHNITLTGSTQVRGSAYSYGGSISSASKLTGGAHSLDAPLSYPAESATTSSPGGNWSTSYGTLAAGTYFFKSIDLKPPQTIATTGPVTIYVSQSVSLKGKVLPYQNKPANLRIVVTSNAAVELSGTAEVYAQIYAPLSDVTFTGNSTFYGGVVGKTVTFTGNSDIHQDTSLNSGGSSSPGSAGAIVLVE